MNIGVLFLSRFEDPGEFLADARAMEAAGVDSVWLEDSADGLDPWLALAAIAAVTSQLRLGLITVDAPGRGLETLQHLSRQRVITERLAGWRRVEVPADREAWAATQERARLDGVEGVLVPLDPRLLDILRHPEDAIDRSDLMLAQG
jgi:alkanesulfonate monooxygenase SsuD/methylene tetrahydromethanopterin reductase-like flavin-dependent oxidoreductase (luciferase family)